MSTELNSVGIEEAKQVLEGSILYGIQNKTIPQNICLHGPPGVGKSAVVQQLRTSVAEKLNMNIDDVIVIDIRLAGMEESTVQGIPYIAKATDLMEFSTPRWFPTNDGKVYILLLDEITNCSVPVQHSAYRLILDRSIQNGAKLPDNCMIVAAGNRKEDKTGAKPLMPAAANRFSVHLNIGKFSDSLNHFINERFHSDLIAYLEYKPSSLHLVTSEWANDLMINAFPTPRTWEEVHKILNNPVYTENETLLTKIVAGCIGDAPAMDFMAFREHRAHLPDWKLIRSGESSYSYDASSKDRAVQFALGISIAMELLDTLDQGLHDECTNLVNEVLKDLPREIKIITFRSMKRDKKAYTRLIKNKELYAQFKEISEFMKS